MNVIYESLVRYFANGVDGDMYKELKPVLIKEGIFPIHKDLIDKGAIVNFQKNLQMISAMPNGIHLALAMMVEVNVSGGILLAGNESKTKYLLDRFGRDSSILATGVSEPGWEGSLRKLKSSIDSDFFLNGTKSFITNGASANSVFWVVPVGDTFPVYCIDKEQHNVSLSMEVIHTTFVKNVNHLKMTAVDLPLSQSDMVLNDYSNLGIELRLKEMFGLISILLGFTQSLPFFKTDTLFLRVWEELKQFRDNVSQNLAHNNHLQVLEEAFPFPTNALLQRLCEIYEITEMKDLTKVNPDFGIFLWDDHLTRYLTQKKMRNIRKT